MTYAIEARGNARRRTQFVEIDVPECVQEWGVSPCLATINSSPKSTTDTFTATNGTLLSSHAGQLGVYTVNAAPSDPVIQSNAVVPASTGVFYAIPAKKAASANHAISIDVTFSTLTTLDTADLRVRGNDTDDTHYWAIFRVYSVTPVVEIYKRIAGTPTLLTSASIAVSIGVKYTFELSAIGTSIEASIDGAVKASATDSSITSGINVSFGAISTSAAAGVFDNFKLITENKCFKTRATCQYSSAFSSATKTYRVFIDDDDSLDLGLDGIPGIKTIGKTAPTKIMPGKGIGYSAGGSIAIQDIVHHDRGVDPYVASRNYDPETQGTYWGRWLARNKYYTNRPIRIYSGYITDAGYVAENFEFREYLIERIDGPSRKGVVTIKYLNIMRKLSTAVAPPVSQVYLTANVSDTATVLPIDTTGEKELPSHKADGTASYIPQIAGYIPSFKADGSPSYIPLLAGFIMPSNKADGSPSNIALTSKEFQIGDSVRVRIGSEWADGVVGDGELNPVTRGVGGTTAETHDSGDTVQKCIVFDNALPTDALRQVYGYGGIIESNINTAQWDEQAVTWLNLLRLNGTIDKPTKIDKLDARISYQGRCYTWWDERTQLVNLLAIAPQAAVETLPVLTDEYNFLADRTQAKRDMKDQVTQALIYYGKRDGAGNNEASNMRSVYPGRDLSAEGSDKWGRSGVKEVFAEFISSDGHASALASGTIGRLVDGEESIQGQLDAKDVIDIWTGSEFVVNSDRMQAADGSRKAVRMQVVEVAEGKDGKFDFTAITSEFQLTRYARFMDDAATPTYSAATDDERIDGAYFCNDLGFMPDGTEGYKFV